MTSKRKKNIEIFRLRMHDDVFTPSGSAEKRAKLVSCITEPFPSPPEHSRSAWKIGHVETISDDRLYFEFGEIAIGDREYYDENAGKFAKLQDKQANHTLIYMDVNLQLVGIMRNSKLAPKTVRIANKLELVMSQRSSARITLGPIEDPKKFVQQLRDSYAVTSFSVTYALPNANLSDDELYKNLSEMTKKSGSEESTITTRSHDNIENREQLVRYANGANATGYSAKARIRESKDSNAKSISLGTNSASTSISPENEDNHVSIFNRIISLYRKIIQSHPENEDSD